MNMLLAEIRRSLVELDLGLSGDLTMTAPMEALMVALAEDRVPASWAAVAYPSLRTLGSWVQNLLQRVAQLAEWTADLQVGERAANGLHLSQRQQLYRNARQASPSLPGAGPQVSVAVWPVQSAILPDGGHAGEVLLRRNCNCMEWQKLHHVAACMPCQ
jgi:hypothetical protein